MCTHIFLNRATFGDAYDSVGTSKAAPASRKVIQISGSGTRIFGSADWYVAIAAFSNGCDFMGTSRADSAFREAIKVAGVEVAATGAGTAIAVAFVTALGTFFATFETTAFGDEIAVFGVEVAATGARTAGARAATAVADDVSAAFGGGFSGALGVDEVIVFNVKVEDA